MKRWVWTRRRITGNWDRLSDTLVTSVPTLLQTACDMTPTTPHGDGRFDLRLFARVAGLASHKNVLAVVGEATRRDDWTSIPLRWESAVGRDLFPAFEGTVELQKLSDADCELAILGSYRPPFFPLGDVVDLLGVGEIAHYATQWLAERLAKALSKEVYGQVADRAAPAGAIAVKDVMTEEPVVFIEDMSLRTGAALLLSMGVSGAPVVDESGVIVGVLSERDLLDKAAKAPLGFGRKARVAEKHKYALTVGQACTRPARTTQADTRIRDAAAEMAEHDIDRLVVLKGGDVAGIVTRTDVLKALSRNREDIDEALHDVAAEIGHQHDLEISHDEGVVHVAGVVQLHSEKIAVRHRFAEVDGVVDVVDDDLSWRVNDLVPLPYSL